MITQICPVRGMHCASCAAVIQKTLLKNKAVSEASVNFGTEKIKLQFDEQHTSIQAMNKDLEKYGYTLEDVASSHNHQHNHGPEEGLQSKVHFILPVTVTIFVVMFWDIAARLWLPIPQPPLSMEWFNIFGLIIGSIALFWVGQPFLRGVGRFIQHGIADMDTLVGIGTLIAFLYSAIITLFPAVKSLARLPGETYFDVTIVVIGFVTLGRYLEARSKKRTGDAIHSLLKLQAKTALIKRDGKEIEVPIEEVTIDNELIVKPGGRIPVDGVIISGESYIDESMVTGEPIPVAKRINSLVIAGTINTTGSFIMRAQKIGKDTMLSHIIAMVEEAQSSKAPIQALADKISGVFVPIVLGLAVISLIAWLTIGASYLGFSTALTYGLLSFVGVLVIACPCALGLATPTAIIVGVGKGAQGGILIKDAATLEKLHKATAIVIDKTGTITEGRPAVQTIRTLGSLSESEIISLVASLEKHSEHPIAQAVIRYAEEKQIMLSDVTNFEAIKGRGLKGTINGKEYIVERLEDAELEKTIKDHETPFVIKQNGNILGLITVADSIKSGAKEAVQKLASMGIQVIMATGDRRKAAESLARAVGITEVVAEVMPQDKLTLIKNLQKKNHFVAMAGDGINDAPALAQADIGIAMATGTDVAIEAAGITLLHGDISKLAKTIRLSKITMSGIKQNLFWAFIYNIIGVPIAAGALYPFFGLLLNPIFAGLAMSFSSLSVVLNSLRLKTKKL